MRTGAARLYASHRVRLANSTGLQTSSISTDMSETRTRVKICGITNLEDARAAVDYGADALGFIYVPESPRYVGDSPAVAQILAQMPPFLVTVGVCVSSSEVYRFRHSAIDAIQYYRQEPA